MRCKKCKGLIGVHLGQITFYKGRLKFKRDKYRNEPLKRCSSESSKVDMCADCYKKEKEKEEVHNDRNKKNIP